MTSDPSDAAIAARLCLIPGQDKAAGAALPTRPAGPGRAPVMALGAFLKASVATLAGGWATLSVAVDDLGTVAGRQHHAALVAHLLAALPAPPRVIAHDRHPDFPTTRAAQDLADRLGAVALPVQHHHAHIAAVAAESGYRGPLLGLALDGFGLGSDDGAWGGELLWVDGGTMVRLGHLWPLPQPGGDVAARAPWRMAAAALAVLGRGDEIAPRLAGYGPAAGVAQMLERGLNAPLTTSAGRLFDAACGLLEVCPVATFEGQAPMALEALAVAPSILPGGWRVTTAADGATRVLDLRPLLAVLADGLTPEAGANLFHGTLAAALADWVTAVARDLALPVVGLSGGCFLNRVLSRALSQALTGRGLRVLTHQRLSPGDASLAVGQAWVAAHHPAARGEGGGGAPPPARSPAPTPERL